MIAFSLCRSSGEGTKEKEEEGSGQGRYERLSGPTSSPSPQQATEETVKMRVWQQHFDENGQ